jgi:hypothetical protein
LGQRRAVGELEVEWHRALRIFGRARAGVEDDVVLGERRRAGDDAFHPLVVGIALDPGPLHALEERDELVGALVPQGLVVEAGLLGQVMVGLRVGRELRGETGEELGVLLQVLLDPAEIRCGRRLGLRGGRGSGGRLGGRLVVSPTGGQGDGRKRRCSKGRDRCPVGHFVLPFSKNVRSTLQQR